MDAVTERVYNHMKSFVEENGHPQSIKQTAKDLNLSEREVQDAYDKLQQSGKIRIITETRNTKIEFSK